MRKERERREGGETGRGRERKRAREREGVTKNQETPCQHCQGPYISPHTAPPPPYISPHTSPSPIRPGPCWAGENTASASGKVSLWFRAPGRLTCGGRPGSRQSPMRRSGRCGPTVRREAAEAELGPSERPAGERFHRCRSPAEDGGERRDQE